MPSLINGNSSERDRAPHMFVMTNRGDPNDDANYDFVGNTTASCTERDDNGHAVATWHIGVAALKGLVCDRTTGIIHANTEPVPSDDMPQK